MPVGIRITGGEELHRVAARLKQVEGGKQVLRELTATMRRSAKPALQDAQRAVLGIQSAGIRGGGGQARRAFAESRARRLTAGVKQRAFAGRGLRMTTSRSLRTVVRTGARSASVRIEADPKRMPRNQRTLPGHMDTGKWRKPVFGNREVWRTQTVTPAGWFSDTVPRHGRRIQHESFETIDTINRRVIS